MIEYQFRCPVCKIVDSISKRDFELWGEPLCDGQGSDEEAAGVKLKPHERVAMKRIYNAPYVVWPASERGH